MTHPRYELKRIGLFSAVKSLFLLGGLGGVLIGMVQWAALWTMYGVVRSLPGIGDMPQAFELETVLSAIAGAEGMIFPLFGGFVGSILGVIAAVVLGGMYNFAARLWGGLEFEWDEVKSTPVVTAPIQAPARPGEATPLPTVPGATPPPPTAEEPTPDQEPRRDDDDDDGDPPRRPSSSMYE